MKFFATLALAASMATSAVEAASSAAAPVYLLRSSKHAAAVAPPSSSSHSEPPRAIPRQIVRQILLQRIGASDATSFAESLPEGDVDTEAVLDLLRQYGVAVPALFADEAVVDSSNDGAPRRNPRQLVVAVEGVQPQHAQVLEDALAQHPPAFAVADPPSHEANERLFFGETAAASYAHNVPTVGRGDVAEAFATDFPATWAHGLFMGLYDLKKSPSTIDTIAAHLPQLLALVESGDVEVMLLLLPETSRSSKLSTWTSKPLGAHAGMLAPAKQQHHHHHLPAELKVRFVAGGESVLAEDEDVLPTAETLPGANGVPSPKEFFAATHVAAVGAPAESGLVHTLEDDVPPSSLPPPPPPPPVVAAGFVPPSCFQSFNACIAQTNSCSSHGTCVDKFSANGGAAGAKAAADGAEAPVCFVCHCFSTLNRPEDAPGGLSTTHWAGSMCQKQDVSVPFWLLTGFGVAMVGAVSFAIGMLFNVGEEKLPGVIGAGVSSRK